MPRFLIEVPHGGTTAACQRAIDIFLSSGSHFLTHAEWGCGDGQHKAWMIIDVGTKEEARNVVPPALRAEAQVVQLKYYSMRDISDAQGDHRV
jgi:hypothetical protein